MKVSELQLGQAIDTIVNLNISRRGSIAHLFKYALEVNNGKALSLTAAENILHTIKPKDKVFLTTGWIDQPVAAPDFAETDGPSGMLVLARAIRQACRGCVILFTDAQLVPSMKYLAQMTGFHCVEPEVLEASIELNKLMTISILPFPVEHEEAKQMAKQMIAKYQPTCLISSERGGLNEAGKIHNMLGVDTSASQAKIDYLFQEAHNQGIMSIAVGDGGNEIGMANIREGIKESIQYGDRCQCECELGISPSTKVNTLMTATVSNWGCYAIVSMIAALKMERGLLHTAKAEKLLMMTAMQTGFHDAIYGGIGMSVDGFSEDVQYAVISLLNEAVEKYIASHEKGCSRSL